MSFFERFLFAFVAFFKILFDGAYALEVKEGPKALLQTHPPVNKFPDFVRALMQRLHLLCPRLGKVKTARILARGYSRSLPCACPEY